MLPWLAENASSRMTEVRETSLGKLVRDEMLALILRGQIAPGERINEPDVAARLGVSRVPVREALRELESSGLVEARKHFGVYVRVLDDKAIADLYDMRGVLDGHAGWRAAQLPAAKRKALGKTLASRIAEMKAQARKHDIQGYYASNLAFHWAVVEAADNDQLTATYRGVVQQLHLARLKNLSRDVGMQASMTEHQQIADAVAEGNAERCRVLLTAHVTASYQRLLERLHEPPA